MNQTTGKKGDDSVKKWLALALAALLLIPALACAEGACEITAQGTAVITAEPDIVSVSANAEITCDTVAQAQAELSETVATVTKSLLALGLQEEDIVTQSYSTYPAYDYQGAEPRLTGYQARHALTITCRDVELLDAVITAVTEGGMSQIYNVSYDVSGRAELYREALALAIDAAGEKAQRMAQPLGLTTLRAKSVTENGGYDYAAYANVTAGRAESAAMDASTGIRSGSIGVSASVTVVYEAE